MASCLKWKTVLSIVPWGKDVRNKVSTVLHVIDVTVYLCPEVLLSSTYVLKFYVSSARWKNRWFLKWKDHVRARTRISSCHEVLWAHSRVRDILIVWEQRVLKVVSFHKHFIVCFSYINLCLIVTILKSLKLFLSGVILPWRLPITLL